MLALHDEGFHAIALFQTLCRRDAQDKPAKTGVYFLTSPLVQHTGVCETSMRRRTHRRIFAFSPAIIAASRTIYPVLAPFAAPYNKNGDRSLRFLFEQATNRSVYRSLPHHPRRKARIAAR
ncbi:MAG: hypothetical protein LBC37_03450 [Zoogloeaceae bacterium]|jgi:hypothetical protein|nr:hypothetical protein [Zoogloeaceae bacterium]